ncbi:hypothetical protein [Gordonia sp. (in: high G+C Gram-positive bacteria)]|uniref:hypothetical protein n=1 Tax=Gordonia sp. (in: high G+C Gram-positive bacteria) TaxID=84139 RepID=UPI003C758755
MHPDDTILPAWREPSEIPVPFDEAIGEWAQVAREVLIETAGIYGALITQAELGSKVQSETGIRAGGAVRLWVDHLLVAVTRAQSDGEPLLASLCVRLDQSVGETYLNVLADSGRSKPEDADMDAAIARFACYQSFGADIPEFARPTLAARVAEKRSKRPSSPPRKTAQTKGTKPTKASAAKAAKPPRASAAKAAAPKAKPKAQQEEPKPKLCPTCYTVLSTSGVCGFCY